MFILRKKTVTEKIQDLLKGEDISAIQQVVLTDEEWEAFIKEEQLLGKTYLSCDGGSFHPSILGDNVLVGPASEGSKWSTRR